MQGRRRHPGPVRRQLILTAARACISERGLAATTVRDIAAAAGVSVGTVTYHFTGINEILVEVIREASRAFTDRLLTDVSGAVSALTRLQLLFDAPLADDPEIEDQWRLWIDYWGRAIRDDELAALHRERYAIWRGIVQQTISDGIAAGEFREVDPTATSMELVGLLDGVGLQVMVGDAQVARAGARELVRSAIAARLLPREG